MRINNILQSIKASLSILGTDNDTTVSRKLLQTNLNQIGTRLESTLHKLKAPALNTQIVLVDCKNWIERISKQYRSNKLLQFHSDIENSINLPIDLFDSVIENLLNNAMKKPSASQIDVRLMSNENIVVLSVCDNGEAIEAEIEEHLFAQPVSSGSGMGIGLYQSAIMALAFNYELELSQNERGRVCFNLYQHLVD